MARLTDRNRQIPNGLQFEIPELGYKAPPYSSFGTIANAVHALVQANLGLAEKKGWPITYEGVCDWVDVYNAEICEANGWESFYRQTRGPITHANRVPNEHWPLWAKALALAKSPEDKGVGDTVARLIGDELSERYKAWYKATFGKVCGCNGRREVWNIKYAY